VRAALELACRVYILNNGQTVFEGTREALYANPDLTARYLGLGVGDLTL
jgi:ABC-type branched-subunit amino acid transport system ATPase component